MGVTLVLDLDRLPTLWWDEGWTMNVARNWVERGWYGQLLNDQPAPPGLSAAFPTVASVALSFKILGVGVWQARLVSVFYTLATLSLLYCLARRLYTCWAAAISSVYLVLFVPAPFLHPVYVGRQVLAEMPTMFFLLLGYLALWKALAGSTRWLIFACSVWGLALLTKAQAVPFWAVSLAVPLAVSVFRRSPQFALRLALALVGSYAASRVLQVAFDAVMTGRMLIQAPLTGLYEVTAVVLSPALRQITLVLTLQTGLPTLVAIVYAARRWLAGLRQMSVISRGALIQLALLSLAGSWAVWYVALSHGVTRYLFPAALIGSLFVGALLDDVLGHRLFKASEYIGRPLIRSGGRPVRWVVGGLIAALFISMEIRGGRLMIDQLTQSADTSAALQRTAQFIREQTPEQALIETYESELIFLTKRRYHYPPDQIHVELIKRVMHLNDVALSRTVTAADWEDWPIDYDPLAAQPDYIVVGPYGRDWQLYTPVLATPAVRLVADNGPYQVYKRVR